MEQPRAPLTRRLTFGQLVAIDVAAALLLAVVLTGAGETRQQALVRSVVPAGLAIALVGVACVGVALRRWRPLTALAVALAAQAATVYLGFAADPMLAVAAVLYVVALVEPPRVAAAALTVVGAALGVLLLVTPGTATGRASALTGRVAGTAIVLLAAWSAGKAVRAARAYADGLREQAERRAQDKVDQARRAVAEERLRIARELHDVVAHSMSVIAVQAGVGGYVIDSRPDEAARALRAIEATSRTALGEMRQLLGLLRDGAPGEMLSAPGLANLEDLAQHTGLRIDLTVRGTPRSLPAGVDLAAFRIVQEALTNVVKHAGTDQSRVVVNYSSDAVAIEVSDNGAGAAGAGESGHGLIGMRERVALYGGEFSAGPLPGGGYRVRARLPAGDAA